VQNVQLPLPSVQTVMRRLFDNPRPFQVARSGALRLLMDVLTGTDHIDERERLHAALTPLLDASEAGSVSDLPAALATGGRPPRPVSAALCSDELETALAAAFRALGWTDLLPATAAWSPSGSSAATENLSGVDVVARRSVLLALAARATRIEQDWINLDGGTVRGTDAFVDTRTRQAAARALGLPVNGQAVLGEVPSSARYGNRMGRSVVAYTLSRLPQALKGDVPQEMLRRALAGVAAVAEAVRVAEYDFDSAAKQRGLRIPDPASPVPVNAWSPMVWWPTLDAWGTSNKSRHDLVPTRWRLQPAEIDACLWLLLYAMCLVSFAAESQRPGGLSLADWMADGLDSRWASYADTVWGHVQTMRGLDARCPYPSMRWAGGEPLSEVDLTRPSSLPWSTSSIGGVA
jgi:hypothetical protein